MRTSCTCCTECSRRVARAVAVRDGVLAYAVVRQWPPCRLRAESARTGMVRAVGLLDRPLADHERSTDAQPCRNTVPAFRNQWATSARCPPCARAPGNLRAAAETARCPRTSCCRRRCSGCTDEMLHRDRRATVQSSDSADVSRRPRGPSSLLPVARNRHARESGCAPSCRRARKRLFRRPRRFQ